MLKNDIKDWPAALIFLAEAIRYYEETIALPDCNTCGKKKTCGYCPKIGERTRINCPLWEGKE